MVAVASERNRSSSTVLIEVFDSVFVRKPHAYQLYRNGSLDSNFVSENCSAAKFASQLEKFARCTVPVSVCTVDCYAFPSEALGKGVRMYNLKRFVLILTMVLAVTGCSAIRPTNQWMRTKVYFGMSKPDGSQVTAEQWQSFVNEVVTPRFPSGLSVVDTAGQWRNATDRIEHEPSKLLVLLHQPGVRYEGQVDEIREAYRQQFNQEAVMKVTVPVQVEF